GGPTTAAKHVSVGSVTFQPTPAGGRRSVSFILVIPGIGPIDLGALTILGDPHHAFTVEFVPGETLTKDANGDQDYAMLAIFSPPDGAPAPFDATLEIPDAAGDPTILYDFVLNGDIASVAEPASAGLLGVGLAGLLWARRRRAMRI